MVSRLEIQHGLAEANNQLSSGNLSFAADILGKIDVDDLSQANNTQQLAYALTLERMGVDLVDREVYSPVDQKGIIRIAQRSLMAGVLDRGPKFSPKRRLLSGQVLVTTERIMGHGEDLILSEAQRAIAGKCDLITRVVALKSICALSLDSEEIMAAIGVLQGIGSENDVAQACALGARRTGQPYAVLAEGISYADSTRDPSIKARLLIVELRQLVNDLRHAIHDDHDIREEQRLQDEIDRVLKAIEGCPLSKHHAAHFHYVMSQLAFVEKNHRDAVDHLVHARIRAEETDLERLLADLNIWEKIINSKLP